MDTTNQPTRFELLEIDLTDTDRERLAKLREERLSRTLAGKLQLQAERAEQGSWMPACGGTEVPFFTRIGRQLLYCWQPSTGRHAYLDCATDIIITDEEARAALDC